MNEFFKMITFIILWPVAMAGFFFLCTEVDYISLYNDAVFSVNDFFDRLTFDIIREALKPHDFNK